jgi:hypothetical protein
MSQGNVVEAEALPRAKIVRSFLTGSRVYGTPREDSDIDLVVLLDADEMVGLAKIARNEETHGSPGGPHYEDGMSIRFGSLNLLCVTDEKHFQTWREGTEQLKAMRPVTREKAIEHLAELRHKNKISGWG